MLDRGLSLEDPREDGVCSVTCVKSVFSIFNLIYILSGLSLVGVSTWSWVCLRLHLQLLSTPSMAIALGLAMAAGILVVLSAGPACAAARRENLCFLSVYLLVLCVVLAAEFTLSLMSYGYSEQVGLDLRRNLPAVFIEKYAVDKDITDAVDTLQRKSLCCGATSYTDWRRSAWLRTASRRNRVPDSCCRSESNECGRSDHPSNIAYTGCLHFLERDLVWTLRLLAALGASLSVLQLLGVAYTAALVARVRALRRHYGRLDRRATASFTRPRSRASSSGYFEAGSLNGTTSH